MVAEGGKIKVLFSYSHIDEDLRDKLDAHLAILRQLDIIETWHDRKILPGDDWDKEIIGELEAADLILLLISSDFINSKFCYVTEMKRAVERHEAGTARVIPIAIRPCVWADAPFAKLQGLPKDKKPVTSWPNLDEAFVNIVEGIQRALDELRPADPGRQPPLATSDEAEGGGLPNIWNVPHRRNPNFTGREDLLTQLREQLASGEFAALTQAFQGLGGVGKTQLATEYAYRHAADYAAVWWVRCEEPAQLASDFAELAVAVGAASAEQADQEAQISAAKFWLDHNGGWLLILDNAPNLKEVEQYLPRSGIGHVIVTSRDSDWGDVARPMSVAIWPRKESMAFLLKRTEQTDEEAAAALAEELGDLPLALEQAGAYMKTTGQSLAAYTKTFAERQKELMEKGTGSQDYPYSVATTWELALERLEEEPAAVELLNLCAFFAPDDIPLDVIREGAEHLPKPLATAAADDLAWNEVLAALREYSLAEVSGDALSLHRLVQAVVRERLSAEEEKKVAEAALLIVNDSLPTDLDEISYWSIYDRLLSHALLVTRYTERFKVAEEATGRLLNQAGSYLEKRARFPEAQLALERALVLAESFYGLDDPIVAGRVSNLGGVLRAQGDLAGAQAHFERAVKIAETAQGQEHPSLAKFLNNLGLALRDQGDLARARVHYERALKMGEAQYGPEHPDVAIRVNNIGGLLRAQGDLVGARAHFERALRIYEAAYGPDHPSVAMSLGNLGVILQEQGDMAGARLHFERALEILRRILGDAHPETVITRQNLDALKE